MTTAVRMPAAERRQALIDTAIRVFSEGSYRGTTTAEIARAAGISEPILYRHFASKRELYLAALDHVWGKMRSVVGESARDDPRPCARPSKRWVVGTSPCGLKFQLAELWVQALGEASEDPELRKHLRRPMGRCTISSPTLIRRGQDEGCSTGSQRGRGSLEFLGGGMLGMVGRRVGLLDDRGSNGDSGRAPRLAQRVKRLHRSAPTSSLRTGTSLAKDGYDDLALSSCGLLFRRDLPAPAELDEIYGLDYFKATPTGYLDYVADEDAHRAARGGGWTRSSAWSLAAAARRRGRRGIFVAEARARGWEAAGSTSRSRWSPGGGRGSRRRRARDARRPRSRRRLARRVDDVGLPRALARSRR